RHREPALRAPAPAHLVDPVPCVLEPGDRDDALFHRLLRASEHVDLDQLEHRLQPGRGPHDREGPLLPVRPLDDDDLALREVLRPEFQSEGYAPRLPVIELLAGSQVPLVDVDAELGLEALVQLPGCPADLLLAALFEDRDDYD